MGIRIKLFGLVLSIMIIPAWSFAQYPGGASSGGRTSQYSSSTPGTGKISGVVLDSTNRQPVDFATVALMNPKTEKPVNGAICDEKGKFTISKISSGTYNVVLSFIGYQSKTFKNISLSDSKNNINLGTVIISPSVKVLNEVTVTGQKPLVEEKVDRLVYNAENDATTKGGDAADVLRRVPMLSVDMDGNVSLRGSDNVKVLINNKPSTITANSVADALQQIPADQIKNVEVITSPSAKYDAEGTAGIININLKKDRLEGFSVNIRGSAGMRGSNGGLNAAYQHGKMGFSLGGFGRGNYNVKGSFDNAQTTIGQNGTQSLNLQSADTRNNGLFGNLHFGWDYEINKKNSITASARYGRRNFNNFQNRLSTQTLVEDSLTNSSLRDVNTKDLSGTIDVSGTYTHDFNKPQQELSFMVLYSRNNRTNNYLNNILDETDYNIVSRLKNDNQSYDRELTFQLDYQSPIGKNQMLEFGGKNISRKVASDYQYFTADGPSSEFVPSANAQLTNNFNYLQNVSAGYISYTLNAFKYYSLMAGARYEYTTINANFLNESPINIPSYGILVPSINFSRRLKMGSAIKAAYNRRIQRPSINYLNPNINASNPLSISYGNPDLGPEYTNNYELSYSNFFKGTSLNISAFMRNTNNSIQRIRSVLGSDTIRTTYLNVGKEDAYGVSLYAHVALSNKFSLSGGTDIYYASLNNNDPNPLYNASNHGWVEGYRLFGNYNIANGWGFQFFGFYRGRRVELQGSQGGFGIYSLSLQKEFNDKRASIGFGAENFLSSSFKINNNIVSPTIDQNSTTVFHNMNFKINFSYRIGKISTYNRMPRNRKTISNDDLKTSEENNPMGVDEQSQMQATPRQQRPMMRFNRSNSRKSTKKSKKNKESKHKKNPETNQNGQ